MGDSPVSASSGISNLAALRIKSVVEAISQTRSEQP
jgi:hypothetical protein